MFEVDRERVRDNARRSSTQDLLERATVYRSGMEPEALILIEEELRRRGVTAAQQLDYATGHPGTLHDRAGLPLRCQHCSRPAVWRGWGWHRLWGKLPLLPRRLALCAEHAGIPASQQQPEAPGHLTHPPDAPQ